MSDIQNSFITNQENFLSEIINGILPKSKAVDILVGYFYFSGFKAIYKQLKDKYIRILVGLEVDTFISNKICEVDRFNNTVKSRGQIKEDYFNSFITIFNNTDTFDSKEHLEAFTMFFEKIKDGSMEIRKTKDSCHAKMYLFEYNDQTNERGFEPGTVITGSSNLSYAGLEGRMEINARFSDKNSYYDGHVIFEKLWSNSVKIVNQDSVDEFDEKVIQHIWYEKLYRPYLLYIRVLKEYFTFPAKDYFLSPSEITHGKFLNLKYQTDATQMAINAINIHNGVIVADVVGLGKSIIASTVARNLKLRTIVICPPHLIPQWTEYRDEFGYTASVFSSGQIERALAHYYMLRKKDEQFLIIIDEAHKYRNEYTQDYALLHNLCANNKMVLLSATPFNNRPDDIFSMIKLFQIPSKSTLKTVDDLGASFKYLIDQYKKISKEQRNKTIDNETIKKEINSIAKQISSIIDPLVIRRSRLDLNEIPEYKKDLESQNIVTVIPNDPELLEYDLGPLKDLYLQTLDLIDSDEDSGIYRYKAARYAPSLYVKHDKVKLLQKELEQKTGVAYNLLLGRQSNISAFMRKLLVRRFESSVEAFKSSLIFMINSSTKIVQWIEKRNRVPIFKTGNLPDVEDFYNSSDDGEEEIQEKFEHYEEKGFFEIKMEYIKDQFLEDMNSDINLLQKILNDWSKVNMDPKLDSFIAILRKKMKEEPNRKILVFSEFADTANYLGRQLKSIGLPVYKYTSADASILNKEIIRANFDAGLANELQKNEYSILIATDAISEGYSLHRAGAIFNYDIPYNPTRVIQRIGRINRVNKKMFEELYVYNYFPTAVGESETRTKEISTLKMAMIHAIMGEDTKALTKEEELKSFFAERYNKEFQKSEELSWDNKYRKLLYEVQGTSDYEKALAIQYRSRSARKTDKEAQGVLMFGKKGSDSVFKMYNKTAKKIVQLTAEEALSLFEADPSEEPFETSKLFDSMYQKTKTNLFKNLYATKYGKERLKAMEKVKLIKSTQLVSDDYLEDLIKVIKIDGLSGYELRQINKLEKRNYIQITSIINQNYLNRIITKSNNVTKGDEIVILAEELYR